MRHPPKIKMKTLHLTKKLIPFLLLVASTALGTPPAGYTAWNFGGKFNNYGWLGLTSSGSLQSASSYMTHDGPTGYPTQFWDFMPDNKNFGSNQSNGSGPSPFTAYSTSGSSPFHQYYGHMAMDAYKDSTGTWHTGMVSTMAPNGTGFVTPLPPYYLQWIVNCPVIPGGYWPGGTANYYPGGPWISGWALTKNAVFPDSNNVIQIVGMELYGKNPVAAMMVVQVSNPADSAQVSTTSATLNMPVPGQGKPGGWTGLHTFGVQVTASAITYYIDNAKVWQTPTPAGLLVEPMFIIFDFSLGAGYPIQIPSGYTIYLEDISCWSPPAL